MLASFDTSDSIEHSLIVPNNPPQPYQQSITREHIQNEIEAVDFSKSRSNNLNLSPIGIDEMISNDGASRAHKKRGKWPSPFLSDVSKASAIGEIEAAFQSNKGVMSFQTDNLIPSEEVVESFENPRENQNFKRNNSIEPYQPIYTLETHPSSSSLAHPSLLSLKVKYLYTRIF